MQPRSAGMAAHAGGKRWSAAEENDGIAEKRRNAMPQMIGFGTSSAITRDAFRDQLRAAYEEEKAAGDQATSASIGCLLFWMSVHRNVPLEETTQLEPKRFAFTQGPVPLGAMSRDTAQVFSVAVKGIKPDLGFQWPLDVYGFVAVRDNLDCRRNIIFCRDRNNCQTLTAEATVDVKVVEGLRNPFCLRINARTKSFPDDDFVLFDSRGGGIVESDEGTIKLSRSVVSVESDGELILFAEAREPNNSAVVTDKITLTPKRESTSDGFFNLGFCKMEVNMLTHGGDEDELTHGRCGCVQRGGEEGWWSVQRGVWVEAEKGRLIPGR
ncbi:hypothetical protein EJB05_12516 [Eragrostis curvula]|uniref:DUF6598 domain-containing protein n=1 Tax=Eragrostis curvula TaxID=38414 RepID=A0A5J9VTZ3_9POAL|nr:hypothetical protein EJB05_12516 [Eragrostis curvula]